MCPLWILVSYPRFFWLHVHPIHLSFVYRRFFCFDRESLILREVLHLPKRACWRRIRNRILLGTPLRNREHTAQTPWHRRAEERRIRLATLPGEFCLLLYIFNSERHLYFKCVNHILTCHIHARCCLSMPHRADQMGCATSPCYPPSRGCLMFTARQANSGCAPHEQCQGYVIYKLHGSYPVTTYTRPCI